MTILAQLVAKETDCFGYTIYVFKCLEEVKDTQYIMCTRYPNWNHRTIQIGEVGYLNFIEIQAGIDKWFNGNEMIPYNYDNIQFIKFIEKPEKTDNKFIM